VKKTTAPDLRILLVEDNPPDVRWFELVLEEAGLCSAVIFAPTGKAAWAELEDSWRKGVSPDVIFLDLNLPVFDGGELLSRIKRDGRFEGIPVCILTGSIVEREYLLREFSMPDATYILKPLQVASLQRALECYSELRRFVGSNEAPEGHPTSS
jgi:two-component system response regulator